MAGGWDADVSVTTMDRQGIAHLFDMAGLAEALRRLASES
jgi:hypothetical protein